LNVAVDKWEKFCKCLINKPSITIKYPDKINLPPVLPKLAREDKRTPKTPSVFKRFQNLTNFRTTLTNYFKRC
jgi:hypothetical protein